MHPLPAARSQASLQVVPSSRRLDSRLISGKSPVLSRAMSFDSETLRWQGAVLLARLAPFERFVDADCSHVVRDIPLALLLALTQSYA